MQLSHPRERTLAYGPDGDLRPHWRADLQLVQDLGLRYLRYGPPLHLIHPGPGQYDWAFLDEVAAEMRRLGIVPIMGLVMGLVFPLVHRRLQVGLENRRVAAFCPGPEAAIQTSTLRQLSSKRLLP